MQIACLDLEGVLIPEIWQTIADSIGNKALRLTTHDVEDYSELMALRMTEIKKEDLRFSQIEKIINGMNPYPGAHDFLNRLAPLFQTVILSDTFYQFALPLMPKLGMPFLLCHQLKIEDDRIVGYELRQEDPKRKSVEAFRALNYIVVAAGDSLNDCTMVKSADCGVLFRAVTKLKERFPNLQSAEEYDALYECFSNYVNGRVNG